MTSAGVWVCVDVRVGWGGGEGGAQMIRVRIMGGGEVLRQLCT